MGCGGAFGDLPRKNSSKSGFTSAILRSAARVPAGTNTDGETGPDFNLDFGVGTVLIGIEIVG
jgi:hypothetical protein